MTQTFRHHIGEPGLVVGLMVCSALLLNTLASAQALEFKIDHFKCYITTNPPVDAQIQLQDQFDGAGFREDVLVRRPVRFCNPVEKIRLDTGVVTPIINKESHLKMYRIFTDDLDLAPTRKVQVLNQFGKKTIRTFQQEVLAVPTAKQEPTGAFPDFHDLDHFKCYRAYGGAINKVVTLRDQFHVEENVKVGYPFSFCNPALKVHDGQITPITNADDHLVCYKITRQPLPTPGVVTRNVRNQFGLEELTMRPADLLCVPSKKLKVSPQTPA